MLRYRDSATSTSVKAKPYGVTQCQIFGMASATPVTDQGTLPMVVTPTKSPFVLNFQPRTEHAGAVRHAPHCTGRP